MVRRKEIILRNYLEDMKNTLVKDPVTLEKELLTT